MPSPQTINSSYTWGGLLDLQRRQGASSVSINGPDQLAIVRKVSAIAYTYAMWPFTLATTSLGQIPCVNMQQDYAQPPDLRALSRAWFNVPTQVITDSSGDGTIPPVDDPSYAAYQAALLSAQYVGSQSGGGTPTAITWPGSGSFDVVKRLPVNLIPRSYVGIREICQQPNQNMLRLSAATAVSDSQPYSLELEYQAIRPPVASLNEACWFPDDYVRIADEGLLYELYRFNNDPRAGAASYSAGGMVNYSGQLAVWMGSMESAAAAERAGSVNNFVPDSSIGAGYYNDGYLGGTWY